MHNLSKAPDDGRPNDARVRGAGPARKPFVGLKACKAPHPLQPIVRPRLRVPLSTRGGAQARSARKHGR